MPNREWDLTDWFADISKVQRAVWMGAPHPHSKKGWKRTAEWYRSLPDKAAYLQSSKRFGLDTKHSVSAIVACYKDGQAIPIMYERLKKTFTKLECRSRDHLRQRLQPGRLRRGDPLHLAQ